MGAIMKNRITRERGIGRRFFLATVGAIGMARLFTLGPALRGQAGTVPEPRYEVAAIMPGNEDGESGFDTEKGRFLAHNVTIKKLVARAYDLDIGLISGGRKGPNSTTFDIHAKFPHE